MLEYPVDLAADPLPGRALHETLARMRAEGPVVPARFFGADAWAVTTYDALADAFRDAQRFPPPLMYRAALEPVAGRSFISMDEPDHRLYRRLATPAFRSRAIERFERSGLEALAHELIDRLLDSHGAELELVSGFSERFPYLVISRMLGLPRDREDEFHRWALGILSYSHDAAHAARCAAEFTSYLAPVVARRRRRPREDVISELVEGEIDGRHLTDEEIYAHVRMLFPTGGETTHSALGNLAYALLVHDGLWDRLREQPATATLAVDELLRWETPIAVLPRVSAPVDVDFHGARIPPGSTVLFAVAAANRDPDVFPDPDRFDLTRFHAGDDGDQHAPAGDDRPTRPLEPLTFGPGPKSCPGLHLARKNLVVAAQVLTSRLAAPVLVDAAAAAPRGVAPRAPQALRVRVA